METKRVPIKAVLYQYGVGLIVGIGGMAAGGWLAWAAVAIGPLVRGEYCCNVTRSEISTMVSLMDFGNILSPIPAAYCMDIFGRKPTLYSTAFMYIFASVAVIAANNVWYLYAARLSVGMAKGVAFAVVPIYLAEIASPQIRGALSAMFIGLLNIGLVYDYVLDIFLSFTGVNIANAILPVLFGIFFYFVPESPYYLAMKEKEKRTIKSLSKYRQVKKDNEALLMEANFVTETVATDMEQKGRFIDLVTTASMRRAMLIITALSLLQRSCGLSPTVAYSMVTLPETGGGFSRATYMVIYSSVSVVANYLPSALVETWGRKKLLMASAASCSAVQGIAGLFYYFRTHHYDVSSWLWVPYACLVAVSFTYSIGIGFVPSTLVGELFPTNIKCHAGSISAIFLATTSFVLNRIFLEVSDRWGVEWMYFYFATSGAVCVIFSHFYVFETKGKTFMEIQNILKRETGEYVKEDEIKTETGK
ncbi:facilitated trehalose transporter Tret1 [Halyomorpha halys]|uniref:facilitated trehalose transporter Tret1 n=1 Tax=Halyomorpha halys TaxID=286706 RepID=UPI0006D4DF02|nr:facilitated trehalose transporter Tret1-like [Halyomorpha halys]